MMFSAVEFHDSDLLSLREVDLGVVLRLDAYVHRWEQIQTRWQGTGSMQQVDLELFGSTASVPFQLPIGISGGTVTVGHARYDNLVVLPLTQAGPTTLILEFENGEVLEAGGQGLRLVPIAAGRFIELLPSDWQPDFGLPSSMHAGARQVAQTLLAAHPAFAHTLVTLDDGHFEASLPAPAESKAGALVVRTAHDGDIWVHLAPPQMWYSPDDEREMLSIVSQLLSDQARFVRIENQDGEWAGTTLLGPTAKPDLQEGQRATIISWSGRFDGGAG